MPASASRTARATPTTRRIKDELPWALPLEAALLRADEEAPRPLGAGVRLWAIVVVGTLLMR